MAGPLRKLGTGDPIPLDKETWNAILGAARNSRDGGGLGAGAGGDNWPPALAVFVRNDTGADLDQFAVVALGEPIISPVDAPDEALRTPCFPGTEPAAATNPFAVLIEPVAEDDTGRAVILGVMVVDVHINDAGHGFAAPGTTSDYLESAASGPAKIIWKESSGSTRRALVLLIGDMGGGSLTAEEVDGTPSYTGTTTLRFDQADGFVVTNPSTGVARVDLVAATATQAGIVSTTTQTIAGNKEFTNAISCVGFECTGSSTYTGYTGSNGIELYQHVTDPGSGDKCGWMLECDPVNQIVYFYVGGDFPSVSAVGVLMLTTIDYLIADRAAYGVRHDFVEYTGYTGGLAPGMLVKGGIIVSAGSGSFLADPGDGLAGGTYP